MVHIGSIKEPIFEIMKAEHPEITYKSYVCADDVNRYRAMYVSKALEMEKTDIKKLEDAVLKSVKEEETSVKNINFEFEKNLSFGDRIADRIATFGGSWVFIGIFASSILTWIVINSIILLRNAFDPFPYVLLNLVLATVATIEAPIIMMSQNRQSKKDRLRDEEGYRTNARAEYEIKHLHEKLDYFLLKEWQRLLEIQRIQTDLIQELADSGKMDKKRGP